MGKRVMTKFVGALLMIWSLVGCASRPPDRWELGTITLFKTYEKTVSETSGLGALLGAVAGAAAGSQVGEGRGKAWATGIGAGAGLLLGDATEGAANSKQEIWLECYVNLDSGPTVRVNEKLTDLHRRMKENDRVNVQIKHMLFDMLEYSVYPLAAAQLGESGK
jgi:outer membrane lipoprotein SlyB